MLLHYRLYNGWSFFWGGDIPGPPPPVWNPAQCSTIKGSIFTKHLKLGHSVYVYILCTSIVVGLAQRSMQVDSHSPPWCRPILKREPLSLFCPHDLQIGHLQHIPETTITNPKVQGRQHPSPWFQNQLSLSKSGEAASFFIHAASTSSDEWIALKYSDTISVSWRVISRGWSYGWDNEPLSFSFVKQHGLAMLKHSIQYEVLDVSAYMYMYI